MSRRELQQKYIHHRTGQLAISSLLYRHRPYATPRTNGRPRYGVSGSEARKRPPAIRFSQQAEEVRLPIQSKGDPIPDHARPPVKEGVGSTAYRELKHKLDALFEALERKPCPAWEQRTTLMLDASPEAARQSRRERRARLKSLATQRMVDVQANGGELDGWAPTEHLSSVRKLSEDTLYNLIITNGGWRRAVNGDLPRWGPCGRAANAFYEGLLMPVADRIDGSFNRVNGDLAGLAGRVDGYLDAVEKQLDPNFKYHEAAAKAASASNLEGTLERWWERAVVLGVDVGLRRPRLQRGAMAPQSHALCYDIERSSRRGASDRDRRGASASRHSRRRGARMPESEQRRSRLASAGGTLMMAFHNAWVSVITPVRVMRDRCSPRAIHDTILGGVRDRHILQRPSLMVIRVSRRVVGALAQEGPFNLIGLYHHVRTCREGNSAAPLSIRGEIVKFIPPPSTLRVSSSLRSLLSAGTGGLAKPRADDSDEDTEGEEGGSSTARSRWIANAEDIDRELDRRMETLATQDSMSTRRTSFGFSAAGRAAAVAICPRAAYEFLLETVKRVRPILMTCDPLSHLHGAAGHQGHVALMTAFTSTGDAHRSGPLTTAFGIKRIYFAANNKDWKLDCNSGDQQDCISECQREFKGDALATHECIASVQRAYSMMPGGGGQIPTCFPVTSRAFVQGKGWTRLSDIDVGDCLLTSTSSSCEPHFEPVVGWLHYEAPSAKRRHRFLRLSTPCLGDVADLYLSAEHLVLTNRGYVPANQVSCNDTSVFKLSALDHQLRRHRVQSVQTVELVESGLACPLLPSGNVIIEGVLCSCYSPPRGMSMSHATIHALAAPLRNGIIPLPPKAKGGAFVYYESLASVVRLFT
ncbi:hypothetical protein FOZ61_005952 [Perkinsus olseni]|uniref:Hedgehog protein Hint domain-containing protein n=1 Tax=Perkinsus olseni TaxID=32597 RepID=A0A7J6MC01_PEROL|nr:hypothetical protein FOZ61_005952 [Perkinsus olseni]